MSVELERMHGGSYCTADERFLVQGRRGHWAITDLSQHDCPTGSARTLAEAEAWIGDVLRASRK
jgi:hypothetical protein